MTQRVRRPWWALLLALFSAFTAMLYIGRPRRAFAYLAGVISAIAVSALGIAAGRPWAIVFLGIGIYGIPLVAAADAFRIARRHRTGFTGSWYTRWYGLLGAFAVLHLLSASSSFLIRSYVVEPVRMPSGSMLPTLLPGDFLVVSKWGYGNPGSYGLWLGEGEAPDASARPRRGDILVFRFPPNPETLYIKRIIGLPGDTVRLSGHALFINGKPVGRRPVRSLGPVPGTGGVKVTIHEENLSGRIYSIALNPRPSSEAPFETTVPEGQYFVLGDYRDNSRDSRYWGFVPATHIVGRPFVIWFSNGGSGAGVRWERIGMHPR